MELTDKDMMHAPGGTHTFPTIQPDSQDSDRSDDCFRPLFQTTQGDFNSQTGAPCDAKEGGKGSDPLAVALKESYERGVAAGNKEACGLAQKELEPYLESFFDRLNAFSDNYSQLTHDCATQIVALALAIARKIVNGHSFLSSDEMSPIQQALDDMLRHHHQLNLQLNSQDLKELADLMRCRNIEMSGTGAIQISDNDTVQRGTPQFTNSHASDEELLGRIIQVLEELPEALQSKKASTS